MLIFSYKTDWRGKTKIVLKIIDMHSCYFNSALVYYQRRYSVDLNRKISKWNIFVGVFDKISPNSRIILNNRLDIFTVFPRRISMNNEIWVAKMFLEKLFLWFKLFLVLSYATHITIITIKKRGFILLSCIKLRRFSSILNP